MNDNALVFSTLALIIFCIVLFVGSPDLHDAMVVWALNAVR